MNPDIQVSPRVHARFTTADKLPVIKQPSIASHVSYESRERP
jgi:hypothetical protein